MKNSQKLLNCLQMFVFLEISLYNHAKKNHPEFVEKENEIINKAIKEQKIKFNKVLDYDEQFVLTNDGWKYKLMAMDPVSKFIYDFQIVDPLEFDVETVVNFLKPIVKENKIKYLSGDGSKVNIQAAEELNLKFKLCGFHKMANLMDIIRGLIRGLIRKERSHISNIEKNDVKIDKIKELRRGKGKPKENDKKDKKLVDDKKKYERGNREYRRKIRKINREI